MKPKYTIAFFEKGRSGFILSCSSIVTVRGTLAGRFTIVRFYNSTTGRMGVPMHPRELRQWMLKPSDGSQPEFIIEKGRGSGKYWYENS